MKRIVFITLLSFVIAGCASKTRKPIDTENLHDLENLSVQALTRNQKAISKIRLQALQETALTIGAQGGLAKRYHQINDLLDLNKKELTQIFNFNGLLLDNNVLPPVLEESTQSLNLADNDTIRVTDHTYKIVKQAHFVTAAPTWNSYLSYDYKKPELPDTTLLPRNKEERKVWIEYIDMGWQQGINQANNLFTYNLGELQRDFKGIILYRKLLAKNMVSKPFVAKSDMGVTTNADNSIIRINDQILRITDKPKLNSNTQKWKPIIVQP